MPVPVIELEYYLMRLMTARFDYIPDGGGIKVCQPGKTQALARIVPDRKYPDMWRVVRPDGSLTDKVKLPAPRTWRLGWLERLLLKVWNKTQQAGFVFR